MRIEGTKLLPGDKIIAQNNPVTGSELPKAHKQNDKILIGERDLIHAIKTANSRLKSYDRKVEISIHEKTGDIMIKILDASTDEVLREIPPEKIKDMIANMLERVGLLVDERT